jgi:hypothetical protein
VVGSSVADEQGNIWYLSEIEVRNDIATTMKSEPPIVAIVVNAKPDIGLRAGYIEGIPSRLDASPRQ